MKRKSRPHSAAPSNKGLCPATIKGPINETAPILVAATMVHSPDATPAMVPKGSLLGLVKHESTRFPVFSRKNMKSPDWSGILHSSFSGALTCGMPVGRRKGPGSCIAICRRCIAGRRIKSGRQSETGPALKQGHIGNFSRVQSRIEISI